MENISSLEMDVLEDHIKMRSELRQILFENDVLSNPMVEDWWILYQIRKNMKPEKRDAESIKNERLGKELLQPIKIFRTSDGKILETALIVGITVVQTTNIITNSRQLEFVYDNTYPMYDINNKYMGYVDCDGIFHNMRSTESQIKNYIKNNKLNILLFITWITGIVVMLSTLGTNNWTTMGIGFGISMISSLLFSLKRN